MLQNPTELPNCQPNIEKMVKGIPWLYPDVENAVHPPLLHVTGFSHLSNTNTAVLSTILNSDWGEKKKNKNNLLARNPRFRRTRSSDGAGSLLV